MLQFATMTPTPRRFLGVGVASLLAAACVEDHPAWLGWPGSSGASDGGTTSATTADTSSAGATATGGGSATSGGPATGSLGTSGGPATSGVSGSTSSSGSAGTGGTGGTSGAAGTAGSTGSTGGGVGGSNTMFITADLYPPAFAAGTGQAPTGAHTICQQEADLAGLPGTFVALLKTSTSNGTDVLGAAEGWRDANGRPVDDINGALWLGHLDTDAAGNRDDGAMDNPPEQGFWAGGNGILAHTCQDWTSVRSQDPVRTGTLHTIDQIWFQQDNFCDLVRPLLCASIDNTDPITVTPAPQSRLAFLSASTRAPGADLATMDALCQADFEAAFGNGTGRTFSALVAPSVGNTPASRLASLPETPWVRADDVEIAGSTTEFATEVWNAFLNVRPDASHFINENRDVVIGAFGLEGIATDATTCAGWTLADASQTFRSGRFGRWTSKTDRSSEDCDDGGQFYLYCFESTPP